MGGISRTVNYRGNRIDIGGHRFFSKSDRVMDWWLRILPLQHIEDDHVRVSYQNNHRQIGAHPGPDPDAADCVMLVRDRLSRIYFTRRFFQYPITLSAETITNLGLRKTLRIGFSYVRSALVPIKPEHSLEDFFINRFGRELYLTFFKSYTEKVWGVPCRQISAEWGAQRVKGLSITKAVIHFLKGRVHWHNKASRSNVETSLIERFLYPKYGPGQMWDEVAKRVTANGGHILTGWRVTRLEHDTHNNVRCVEAVHCVTGESRTFHGEYFFSTMPVKDLIAGLIPKPPHDVKRVADGLIYRDFITVGLLCNRMAVGDGTHNGSVMDNWIYVQEPDVKVGRLQIFNNWSPYMVSDRSKVWLGLEYFCFEGDDLWQKSDEDLIALAKKEMNQIGIVKCEDVVDATVIRMPKTYPAYFGTYGEFPTIVDYVDRFGNLFLIGRNGMHKYNNQDHSMLAAMTAVDNIVNGVRSRENLWSLNTEQEYHERKD
jgi:protoporphyrinogen oxidase